MVKKSILILLTILLSLIVFAPKRELYYLLESNLLKYDIIIHNEALKDGFFDLKIEHPELYFKGIQIAKIEEISLFSLLVYSQLKAKGVNIDDSLRSWMPEKIDTLKVNYEWMHPKSIALSMEGSFGVADGYIELNQRTIHMDLTKEGSLGPLKSLLKKGEKGWYYEASF